MTKRGIYVAKKQGVYVDVEKGKVGLYSDLKDTEGVVFTKIAFEGLERDLSRYGDKCEYIQRLTTEKNTLKAIKKSANFTRGTLVDNLKDGVSMLNDALEQDVDVDLDSLRKMKKDLEKFIKESKGLIKVNKEEDEVRGSLRRAKGIKKKLSSILLEGVKANLEKIDWCGKLLTYKDLKGYYAKLVEDTKDIFKGSIRVKKDNLVEDGSCRVLGRRYTLVDIINKHLVHLKGRLVVNEEVEDVNKTTKRFNYAIDLEVEDEDLEISYENFEKIVLALDYFVKNYD